MVQRPLLWAFWSLYIWSSRLVLSSQTCSQSMLDCPFSPMNRILRHNQAQLFADVILLALSNQDLQHVVVPCWQPVYRNSGKRFSNLTPTLQLTWGHHGIQNTQDWQAQIGCKINVRWLMLQRPWYTTSDFFCVLFEENNHKILKRNWTKTIQRLFQIFFFCKYLWHNISEYLWSQ